MISRKYADDFRMEKSVNDKGKVVKKAVYIGPYFAYCAEEKELALSRRLCLPVCLLLCLVSVLPPLLKGRFYRWQGVLMLALYAGYVVMLVA